MVSTRFALVGALAGAAQATAWANTTGVVYTTEVVTELTTYCPAPTTLTHGDKTYTVTEPTTLTITDCPCTISKPVEPTSPPKDECSAQCITEYRKCQGAPDANQSYCASQIAECLGYNPFEHGSFVTPTACSEKPAEPTTPPKDECAEKCTKSYNECRVAPHANMATCAAEYAECLNFNPFDGSNKTVTACSEKPVYTTEVVTHLTTYCPEPTTLTFDHSTYTVTEPTTLTISDCSCTVSKPVETPSKPVETHPVPSEPAGDCPTECTTTYNECRGAPGSNKATCAAQYSACLGYSPFDKDGSLVTPTACSQAPQPTATQPPTHEPTTPGQPETPEQPDTPEQPGQPSQPPAQPEPTTLQPSATTPGVPGTPENPSSVPTAGAANLSPLKALGVIAAVALL